MNSLLLGVAYSFAGILLYLGSLFLVPIVGIIFFLGLIAGINLLSIPMTFIFIR